MKKFLFYTLPLLFLAMAGCSPNVQEDVISSVFIGNDEQGARYMDFQSFCLSTGNDSIRFIKAGTSNEPKPVFVFLQGSLPVPLFIDYGSYLWSTHANLLDKRIFDDFHVVEISMPHTPLVCAPDMLDANHAYTPTGEPYVYDDTYRLQNNLSNYVERANRVIDYIAGQDWAVKDSIVIYGHSQGAVVAVHLAKSNPHIQAVSISSCSILGRMQCLLLSYLGQQLNGQITYDEYAEYRQNTISNWEYFCTTTDEEDIQNRPHGDLPTTWLSFSEPLIAPLCELKQPVFVVYGTKDYQSLPCELLPLFFIQSGKTNYHMFPVVGCGHNFEPVSEDGTHNWRAMRWHEVTDRFTQFIKTGR